MAGARKTEGPKAGTKDDDSLAQLSFEDALNELSGIVEQIAGEDCPIDSLEERVRRAADLIRMLRERLGRTEGIVTEILDDLQDSPEAGG
jgi:exodeoxyribonuclease VII small subunit